MTRQALLLVSVIAPFAPSHADTLYKCQTSDGRTTYSNQKSNSTCEAISQDRSVPSVSLPKPSNKNRSTRTTPSQSQSASGTAFYINSETLITNYHVVEKCRRAIHAGKDGKQAKLIAYNNHFDLAALKINKSSNNGVLLSRDNPQLGSIAIVLGYPLGNMLGSELTVTTGAISSFPILGDQRMIQLTAPVQPGNSGGPIFNELGHVVGVIVGSLNSMKVAQMTGSLPQNVNFGIPLEKLNKFLIENNIDHSTAKSSTKLATEAIAESNKLNIVQLVCQTI